MKLVQFNAWQGRIIRYVTRFLEEEKPDIVCLNEVYTAEKPVPTLDAFSAMELIHEALPHEYLFYAPLYAFKVAGRNVTYGNAILSRYPIHDKHIEFTSGHFVADMAVEDLFPNTRNYQSCELELPDGKRLSLVNHHGFWDATPLGSPVSREKMEIVKKRIDSMSHPLIFTGDMNVTPASEAMRIFEGSLENLTKTHNVPTTLTSLARAFDNGNMVPCDNTLVSPDIKVTRFEVSDYLASDHKASILEFEV